MARKIASSVNNGLIVDNARDLKVRQESWTSKAGKDTLHQQRKVGTVTAVRDSAGRFHGMTNVREVR